MRRIWVIVHRYVGLSMAVFLVIAGLTGSVLVFYKELDAAINPNLYELAHRPPKSEPLDPLVIREALLHQYPDLHINWITLKPSLDHALRVRVSPKETDGSQPVPVSDFDEIFVDPYTAQVLGTRRWGKITDGVENLIPFLYKLHFQLALDRFGSILLGIIALLWTIDCIVGVYLTLPRRVWRRVDRGAVLVSPSLVRVKTWFRRWWPAWVLRWRGNSYKLNFDLHTSAGLWVWAMLFVLAWSSVAFNLGSVYQPVMASAFDFQGARGELPRLTEPNDSPGLSYAEGREAALSYLASRRSSDAKDLVYQIEPTGMSYIARHGVYHYRFRSNRDVDSEWGRTRLYIDGDTGEFRSLYLPTGKAAGDTLTTWIKTPHMAGVWGLPFRIFVCFVGVIVALLSVTGVIIWWRKRTARKRSSRRRQETQDLSEGISAS